MGNDKKKLVGVGVGVAGALFLALKYALRPATKSPVPDAISPAIFKTKVLHTSLGQVVFHESGSGQPVIFVHNVTLGASSYEWSKVYPHLASGFRVLALDLVGFGESSRPQEKFAATDYVRMLSEFIRATCGGGEPILIGSGLGGGFCAYLATQHPELVSRLILLMPTGLRDFGRQRLPLRAKMLGRLPLVGRFVYRNSHSTRAAVRAWLERFAYAEPARLSEETVDIYTTCAQQYGAEHAMLNFQSGRLSFDLETRMKMVTQPVTLLWATESEYPPIDWAHRFREAMPRCNLVLLPGVSTLAPLEDPALLIETLDEELQSNLRVYRAG